MGGPNIRIVEVGPRDGLQNQATPLTVADRIELIDRLTDCGLPAIEVGSFVSPKWVPQMADSAEVYRGIARRLGVAYPMLVPNRHGMELAIAAGVTEVAVFAAASDAFSRRNINASIDESFERFEAIFELAQAQAIRVRGYVSTVLGCPYAGEVPLADVVRVAARLHRQGCYEISLGDTIGVGTPRQAARLIEAVAADVPVSNLAVHFHDTRGQALANVAACIARGVRVVDSSVAGTGGCPYAEGASGNLATEDLVYMLHGDGFQTGVDLAALIETGRWLAKKLDHPNASRTGLAGLPNAARRPAEPA